LGGILNMSRLVGGRWSIAAPYTAPNRNPKPRTIRADEERVASFAAPMWHGRLARACGARSGAIARMAETAMPRGCRPQKKAAPYENGRIEHKEYGRKKAQKAQKIRRNNSSLFCVSCAFSRQSSSVFPAGIAARVTGPAGEQ
jgi:hypothetical protein